ncbi:MAG: hypothetical protein GY856_07905 [bacterium]|nr:hypothetical protein [bacterium]
MSERKYSQRGYMADDPDDRRERRKPGPPRRDGAVGPRGRGLGKPTATVFRCAVCGDRQSGMEVAPEAVCGKCGTDLHTCTHCAHFDPGVRNECRQPIRDYVSAKAKRNHCEHMTPRATQEFAADRDRPRPSGGKAAFDALFKI